MKADILLRKGVRPDQEIRIQLEGPAKTQFLTNSRHVRRNFASDVRTDHESTKAH